jgi:hypothetical protein
LRCGFIETRTSKTCMISASYYSPRAGIAVKWVPKPTVNETH